MSLGRRLFLGGGMAALALPAVGAPRPVAKPRAGAGLVGRLIAGAGLSGEVGYALIAPDGGGLVEGRGTDLLMPPASTMKALTASYARNRLGGGHRFATRLLATGPVEHGVVQGDLVLAGGGDPVLDSDDLDGLAGQLRQAGVRAVRGRFLVWQGALPFRDRIDDAQPEHVSYNPAVSGLMLNFNRVHLEWRRNAGGYALALDARADGVAPRAYTVTAGVERRNWPIFDYQRRGPREHWSVAQGALGTGGSRWLPVRDPARYAGDVFQTLARARGTDLPAPELVEVLPQGAELARHDSPELDEILAGMLKYSTNLTAEAVGLAGSAAGGQAQSAAEMRSWLWGRAPLGPAALRDHSGLSPGSEITPYGMALALAFAGRENGLAGLMRAQPLTDARGREYRPEGFDLRAKTGTLNFVSNLCGYLRSRRGTDLVFVIYSRDARRRAAAMDSQSDLAPGAEAWIRRAKHLQSQMIEAWAGRY